MNNIDNLPDILTAKDISKFLGISYNSTLNFIKYNLAFVKFGNTYRVTKEKFLNFLDDDHSKEAIINVKD